MKRRTIRNFKRGFTLVELMVTMALLAVVAGGVVLLIVAMGNFSDGNSAKVKRINRALEIREQIDFWFSAMDSEGFSIQLNSDDALVAANGYCIRWRNASEGGVVTEKYLQFTYPTVRNEKERLVEISAEGIQGIYFSKREEGNSALPEADSEDELVFPIVTHVVPAEYLCKISFIPQ